MIDAVMNILNILILSLNISITASNINIKKITIKEKFIITAIIFLPSYILYIINLNDFLVPSSIIIISLCFYWILKNVYYSVLISVFTQIIFALSDAVVGLTIIVVFKMNYSEIAGNKTITLIMSLVILLLSYVISKIFYLFLEKKYSNSLNIMIRRDTLILSFCLITACISIYTYTIIIRYWLKLTSIIIITANLFFIAAFFILLIIITNLNSKNIKRSLENTFKETELNQLKEYTEMVEAVSNDLRSFKHDYINIIQIIGHYIDSKKFEELDKFYKKELIPESKKILEEDKYLKELRNIKIDPLKGLISSKIAIAQSKGINAELQITEDINEIPIDLIDICRIIGNLLDNAIEAAELSSDKLIEILAYSNEKSITFIISNSCPENVPPIYKIYEKNFSTKGAGRGIGLKTIRNIINEKYKNVTLSTNIENLNFRQELVISLPYTRI